MNTYENIRANIAEVLKTIPTGVILVAAAKTRTAAEADAAIRAGVHAIGHNYIQEAEQMQPLVTEKAPWHMIGHLQRNKVKKAVELFDMIETLDSLRLAHELEKQCAALNKTMPVLIEINSGKESNKTGVLPEHALELIPQINTLKHLKISGLMTMGPRFGNPEDARPYYQITKALFEKIKKEQLENVEMKYLSMGMSNSYQLAIEEGANIVRIGTSLFGPRACSIKH